MTDTLAAQRLGWSQRELTQTRLRGRLVRRPQAITGLARRIARDYWATSCPSDTELDRAELTLRATESDTDPLGSISERHQSDKNRAVRDVWMLGHREPEPAGWPTAAWSGDVARKIPKRMNEAAEHRYSVPVN